MKVIIMVCTKKVLLRTNGPFWAQKWHVLLTLELFNNFSEWKGADRYMKNLLVVFQEKKSFGAIWSFWPLGHFLLFDWAWSNWVRPLLIRSLNSQDMISFMIATGSLNSQDMIRILKQWRHDFSGKQLCDGYFMDVV